MKSRLSLPLKPQYGLYFQHTADLKPDREREDEAHEWAENQVTQEHPGLEKKKLGLEEVGATSYRTLMELSADWLEAGVSQKE